jgi:prophage antirepressor-like protein
MRKMADQEDHAEGSRRESLPVEFTFENHAVRTVIKDGEVWFIAADVCKALEHTDTSKALSRLDEDEKGTTNIRTLGGDQNMLIVNEFGLYGLILTSRKPEAKRFKRWVIHEVLPSIRKTGRYEAGQPDEPRIDESDAELARQRFKEIFSHGFVNPDSLLQMLFGENIPFTGDAKFRFFGTSVCDALGIDDHHTALDRLPESQKISLAVFTPAGQQQLVAITEAAVYVLAFHRKTNHLELTSKAGTLRPSDLTQLDCLALCYSLKLIEVFWYKFLDTFDGIRPMGNAEYRELAETMLAASQNANHLLRLYGDVHPSPEPPPKSAKH